MVVQTSLTEVQKTLEGRFDTLQRKGSGAAVFLHITNKGRGVEISEHDGGFWMEFWEKSNDEDAAPVKELTVHEPQQVLRETIAWLA